MQPARLPFALAALAALASGCGGPSADPAFVDAAPSYQALAMNMTAADATPPGALTASAEPAMGMPGPDPCHPHLFVRTWSLVHRVNRHLHKFLGRVESVMAHAPVIADGTSHVWERTLRDDVTVRLTISRNGQVFGWTMEMKSTEHPSYLAVFTGSIDRTGATGPHQGSGEMDLDLTALKTVIPAERASGEIKVPRFVSRPDERLLVVDAIGVAWDFGPPDMMDPDVAPALEAPHDAHYVFLNEPGKGGSLKAADEMVFLCPSNPDLLPADGKVVARWYRTDSGSEHGRADGLVSGGQLGATQSIVGVTCHQSATDSSLPEGYWLMKLEDAGSVVKAWQPGGSTDACDPAFGPVPAADSTADDFDFTAVSFGDGTPYPFPGM
jgi:hypothetical protein